MNNIIIETLTASEKVAVMKDKRLERLLIDSKISESIVSNIYRGIVKKVLKGMNACFVDIGLEKNAYLKLSRENEDIKAGQEIIVQVVKDEIGSKGAKLTTEISISGRYLVYIPSNDRVTMSNKIVDEKERMRLKRLFYSINGNETGFIIRTESQGCSAVELKKDINDLKSIYNDIKAEEKRGMGPKLLYGRKSLAIKYIRDNINNYTDKIILNNEEQYEKIKALLKSISPDYVGKAVLEKNIDIFDIYGVDREINKCLGKKVWLKSGGYLIIEKTEALTVIDVNSGKFTGSGNLEDTSLRVNIEAAMEAARQIMLRDIGGIIIIDFVDMYRPGNKKLLINELKKAFEGDNRNVTVTGMTSLGLVEIARRREKDSMESYYLSKCRRCGCENSEMSDIAVIDKIEKEIIRMVSNTVYREANLYINSDIYDSLASKYIDTIKKIQRKYGTKIHAIKGSNYKYFRLEGIKSDMQK